MCLLIFKPKEKKIPTFATLKAAAEANPDGFGFATPTRYMRTLNFDKFYEEIQKVPDSEPCIIHLRFATHGSIKTSNCHPFKRNGVTFAHNGILNIEPLPDKTDSETAFILRIFPAVERYGLFSRETSRAVNSIIGSSKFAIMDSTGATKLFGDFTRLEDGNFYSNLRFRWRMLPYAS